MTMNVIQSNAPHSVAFEIFTRCYRYVRDCPMDETHIPLKYAWRDGRGASCTMNLVQGNAPWDSSVHTVACMYQILEGVKAAGMDQGYSEEAELQRQLDGHIQTLRGWLEQREPPRAQTPPEQLYFAAF